MTLTPIQLDDEVSIVAVEDCPHWTMGGKVEGVVRVRRTVEGFSMFDTHNILTREAGRVLLDLMADGDAITWSDIISIAIGAVPTED